MIKQNLEWLQEAKTAFELLDHSLRTYFEEKHGHTNLHYKSDSLLKSRNKKKHHIPQCEVQNQANAVELTIISEPLNAQEQDQPQSITPQHNPNPNNLEKKMQDICSIYEKLFTEVTDSNEKIEAIDSKISALSRDLQATNSGTNVIIENIQDLNRKYDNTNDTISLTNSIHQQKELIRIKDEEITILKKKLNDSIKVTEEYEYAIKANASESDILKESLIKELSQYKHAVQQSKKEIRSMKIDLQTERENSKVLNETVNSKDETINQLKAQLQSLMNKNEILKDEIEILQSSESKLQSRLDMAYADISKLNMTIDNIQETLDDTERDRSNLAESLKNKEEDCERSREEVKSVMHKLRLLENQCQSQNETSTTHTHRISSLPASVNLMKSRSMSRRYSLQNEKNIQENPKSISHLSNISEATHSATLFRLNSAIVSSADSESDIKNQLSIAKLKNQIKILHDKIHYLDNENCQLKATINELKQSNESVEYNNESIDNLDYRLAYEIEKLKTVSEQTNQQLIEEKQTNQTLIKLMEQFQYNLQILSPSMSKEHIKRPHTTRNKEIISSLRSADQYPSNADRSKSNSNYNNISVLEEINISGENKIMEELSEA